MTTYETKIDRVISEEIYTLAGEFVQGMQVMDGEADNVSFIDDLLPCMTKDDYREPVEDAIRNGTAAMLWHIALHFGYELFTKDGVRLEGEPDEVFNDHLDAADFLENIEADDNWQEVADHLDLEPHTVEALQFWLVSDWLAERLEESGALVARGVMGFNIWGRTECGQGLDMDSDLKAVVADMEKRLHAALHGPALDQDAVHYGPAE